MIIQASVVAPASRLIPTGGNAVKDFYAENTSPKHQRVHSFDLPIHALAGASGLYFCILQRDEILNGDVPSVEHGQFNKRS